MTSRHIPIYLFAAFIIILLVVLTFVAKDENQKIYRPGTLEKYLLQKAARIHQHIRQTLRSFAQRPALPAHIPETRAEDGTLTFHGALSHNGIVATSPCTARSTPATACTSPSAATPASTA